MISSVLPILGCTAKEASNEISLGRIYAAYHVAIERAGNKTQWPNVIEARKALSNEWMKTIIISAYSAPLEGIAKLD